MTAELLVAGARRQLALRRPPAWLVAALVVAVLALGAGFALWAGTAGPPAPLPGHGSYDPGPQYQPLLGRPLT